MGTTVFRTWSSETTVSQLLIRNSEKVLPSSSQSFPSFGLAPPREKSELTNKPDWVEVLPETPRSISLSFSLLSSATINASESSVLISEAFMMAVSLIPNLIMSIATTKRMDRSISALSPRVTERRPADFMSESLELRVEIRSSSISKWNRFHPYQQNPYPYFHISSAVQKKRI